MKKFAKLINLVLVLVLMVSILAIPAAATSDPINQCSLDVEPRYPVVTAFCPYCDVKMEMVGHTPTSSLYACPICGYERWY